MSRTKTYDAKCQELAEHFLSNEIPSARSVEALAIHIQEAVEEWFAIASSEHAGIDSDTAKMMAAVDRRARSRMTDEQIEKLCREIDEMARRIGCQFVPDLAKIAAYKRRRDEATVNPSTQR